MILGGRLGTAAFRPAGAIARAILDDAAVQFAAPELFAAEGSLVAVDWRGDLYSLALTLCTLLSAQVAPADADAPSVQLPFDVVAEIRGPYRLRAVLELSLRRAAPERPASLDAVRDAFHSALGEAGASRGPVASRAANQRGRTPPRPTSARHRSRRPCGPSHVRTP